jgi:hypothetical protein
MLTRRRTPKLIQARPSRAKLNQAELLGLIWFYSSESGLFNGLQRIQIKISLPGSFPPDADLARPRERFRISHLPKD